MADFSIKSILQHIDIIDNKKNTKSVTIDNVINNNDARSRYALGKDYEPRTNIASTAKEICNQLNDCHNFALHYDIVKRIGPSEAYRLLQETLDDRRKSSKIGKPIKNPAALYNWKVGKLLHHRKKL